MLHRGLTVAVLACLVLASACSSTSPGGPSTAGPSSATFGPSAGPTVATPSFPAARVVSSTAVTLPAGSGEAFSLIATDDAVWVQAVDLLLRIDPATNAVSKSISIPGSDGVIIADGSAWITDFDASLVHRVDLTTGSAVAAIPVGLNPEGIVAAFGSIWTANHRGGSVSRIDPATNAVVATVDKVGAVGRSGPQGIAAGADRIWVDVPNVSRVIGIDPLTNAVATSVPVDTRAVPCGDILVDGATLWVSSCGERWNVTLVDPIVGSATILSLPGYAGVPTRIGEIIWVPTSGETETPVVIAFRRNTSVADVIALPARSVAEGAAVAFGSLWIGGPAGTVLRIPLGELGG